MLEKPVNVSSVPQRSPFRYPGGKTWLIPQIRKWLGSKEVTPKCLLEPFAGGGVVTLTAVAEGLVDKAVMVELDHQVAAVWKTILSRDWQWLNTQIGAFTPTFETVSHLLAKSPRSTRELAFQTIVRNRTSHGGILAEGSGLLKRGEKGKGVASRWYGATLQKRILAIQDYAARIQFVEGDAFEALEKYCGESGSVAFIDPPYTADGKKAGSRLYTHWDLDHNRLFELATSSDNDFLMTYDNEVGAIELAREFQLDFKEISMQNTHLAKMKELLISRDLTWV